MRPFSYLRAGSATEALDAFRTGQRPAFLAGGTTLLDLMKQDVEHPELVIDLGGAPELASVEIDADGALRIGAMTTLAHAARHPEVKRGWPLLTETILKGLTPQLRDAATFGGNITQRPRCIYFRETGFACNKREPGSGCSAQNGVHYAHAIFGGEAAAACIAVHPSDLCVALTALGAVVHLTAPDGERRALPITQYHRMPDDDATRETTLHPGELVTHITIPPQDGLLGAYAKVPREGFALASAAALIGVRDGIVTQASICIGGVAHKPWPAQDAAAVLIGRAADEATFEEAAAVAAAHAVTDRQTAFRPALLRAIVREALLAAAGKEPRA